MSEKKTKDEIRFGPMIGPNARLAVRRNDEGEEPVVAHQAPDGAPIPPDSELI